MTQAMLTRWLGAVLAVGLLVLPGRTDTDGKAESHEAPAAKSQPYVVLVGVSNYTDKHIKPRPHAEDDARALYKLLTDKKYLGVDAEHARLLLGNSEAVPGSKPATRANILEALHWLADKAHPNDLVIFGFFGEGGPLSNSGDRRVYFASDSTFKNRAKDAIADGEIADALKGIKSQRFCTFLDVDFKGFDPGKQSVAEPTLGTSPYKEFLGDDGTDDHAPRRGRVIFLATNGLTRSLDLKDHGVFAQAVLDGLEGAADKDGYEPDGHVTVDELTEYLDKQMPELTREHGKTKAEKEQAHFVLGGRGNHYDLTIDPKAIGKVRERLDKFNEMVKDGKVPEKFAEEGRTLLEHMPRLEAQRNLRKQYQALVDGSLTLDKFESERGDILEGTKLRRAEAREFAVKVMEAITIINEGYVKKVDPGEMVAWAIRGLYRRVDEKVPPAIEERLKKAKDLKESELVDLLADARQALGKREDLAGQKDINFTLQRMLNHLDPYTTYIDPEQKARMTQDIEGNFTGIGIQIRKDAATDQLLVVTPIKGSPAFKAGLQAGDLITTVIREVDSKGEPLDKPEVLQTKGLPLNQAVKKILGKPGTDVKLIVKREGEEKPLEFTITRGRVEVESVLGIKRKANADWEYMIDPESKIGYVRLTQFARNSYRDLQKVMDKLVDQGARGFILDLRFNPGGLLDSAVNISDLYIDDGLIVSIRPRIGREAKFRGKHAGSLLEFPMVCMVNGYSASGSEIVSACLQDHKRAYIIGERSYGKGSVQNIMNFYGGELKLTTASFWRPSGKNLNKSSTSGKAEDEWGVTPDKVIELSRKEREELAEHQHNSEIIHPKGKPAKTDKSGFKDRQLDEALDYLRTQIKIADRGADKKAG
jgi:carboxyl-terminal processing protease